MDRQLSNGAVTTVHYTVSATTAPIPLVRMAALAWINLKTIRN